MDPQRNFMNVPPIDYKISDWSNGDTCLKCDFYSQLSKVNMTSAPDWTTGLMKSSVCVDCSMANSNAPFTVVKQQLSGPNLAVAGHGAAAANAELNNSSDSWSDNKTHLGLLIGGVLLIGLILIGFGGWISWRYAHKRNRSAATIGKMARETDTNHIDITLTSNPAVGQSSY